MVVTAGTKNVMKTTLDLTVKNSAMQLVKAATEVQVFVITAVMLDGKGNFVKKNVQSDYMAIIATTTVVIV